MLQTSGFSHRRRHATGHWTKNTHNSARSAAYGESNAIMWENEQSGVGRSVSIFSIVTHSIITPTFRRSSICQPRDRHACRVKMTNDRCSKSRQRVAHRVWFDARMRLKAAAGAAAAEDSDDRLRRHVTNGASHTKPDLPPTTSRTHRRHPLLHGDPSIERCGKIKPDREGISRGRRALPPGGLAGHACHSIRSRRSRQTTMDHASRLLFRRRRFQRHRLSQYSVL